MTKRICSVEKCGKAAPYKHYCTKHYQQVKKHGKVIPEPKKYDICQAPGCNDEAVRKIKGLCEKHYMRLRRNGQFESIATRVPKSLCVAEDCGKPAYYSTGECRNCYLCRKRNGDHIRRVSELHPSYLADNEVTYSAIHQRITVRNGSAKKYICVDCGGSARQWSYVHGCTDERIGVAHDGRTPAPFCHHLDHYQPRCVPCHKDYDLGKYPLNERPYAKK